MRGLRSINVPRLLQVDAGALDGLPDALRTHFDPSRVVVATGADVSRTLGDQLAGKLESDGSEVEVEAGLRGSLSECARLLERLDEAPKTLVVAVGGGQPIDVAKLAACRARVDLVVLPTILSHDGIASPVASLTAADGFRRSLGAKMPEGVVIDLDVVGPAPDRFVRAGIGDLVSNLTAVDDWRAAHARSGEPFDEFAASIAMLGAGAVLDVEWPLGADDLAVVARGLLMSGLAMEVAGSSRPCSGAEHLVSHALDQLRGASSALHGEHVAIGVLLVAALQESAYAERIHRLFDRIGIPRTLAAWDLDEHTLAEAIRLAPATRPGRRTALDDAEASDAALSALIGRAFAEAHA